MYDELDNPGKSNTWKFVLGGLIILACILGLAIGLGVGLKSKPEVLDGAPLPACDNSTEILILIRTDVERSAGGNPVVARCYDNMGWEAVTDLDFEPLQIECDGPSNCVISPGQEGTYEVSSIDVPADVLDQDTPQQVSRFLSQATFGGSLSDIQNLASQVKKRGANPDFKNWIKDQMNLPATLLRTYYRQRTNPRQGVADAVGSLFYPCDVGSRYHRFALTIRDESKQLVVSATEVPNMYTFRVDGVLRTTTNNFLNQTFPSTNLTFPMTLTICLVQEAVGGIVSLSFPNGDCKTVWGTQNPAISFPSLNSSNTKQLTTAQATLTPVQGAEDAFIMTSVSTTCPTLSVRGAWISYNGEYYKYDPRLKFLLNSLEDPSSTPAEGSCPTAPTTFLNQDTCVKATSCAPVTFNSAPLTLNTTNLRAWYVNNNRYVYYIQALRLETPYFISPCKGTSRWQRSGGACPAPTNLDALTLATFKAALSSSADKNPFVRDITLTGVNCTANSATVGAQVDANGECFTNVHPDLYTVRDMTIWVQNHDGNVVFASQGLPNPIAAWAVAGGVSLSFPASHPLQRWADKNPLFPVLGRWGDVISFSDLPSQLQTKEMASLVGALVVGSQEGFKVCGSPGESANNPVLGNRYQLPDTFSIPDIKARELDQNYDWGSGKNNIWLNVILTAQDQLRQRVAWALAQIFTISEVGVERGSENESWATFYDIFVRNAFGNYRDMLREVSFSPMMGSYLTYLYNTGFAYKNTYPDENYAREVMQLFSVGLYKINDDYSQQLDEAGNPLQTYTNDDILDMARLWTGFDFQPIRGNIEQSGGPTGTNIMDPMQIHPGWRDKFPKAKLDSGFLGDQYPLCEDLPPNHWTTIGATFTLTGNTSIEGPLMDAESPDDVGHWGRFAPKPATSALYQKLCAPDASGSCTFPIAVTLDENLPCDGIECTAQRVISVKIVDQKSGIRKFYTYASVPCVRLTFFEGEGNLVGVGNSRQCANPTAKIAFPICCHVGYPTWAMSSNQTYLNSTKLCSFANEAMDYQTARDRCTALGWPQCNLNYTGWTGWSQTCVDAAHMWLNGTCTVNIEVLPSGLIGIVDPTVTDDTFKLFKQNSGNVFRVRWDKDSFPDPANCAASGCTSNSSSGTCICPIVVKNTVVFTEPVAVLNDPNPAPLVLPTPQEIFAALKIGGPDPASFPSDAYTKCSSDVCSSRSDVIVWLKAGSKTWDETTIFQLEPQYAGGKNIFLLNYNSNISVQDKTFRNPPHFMPLLGEQTYTWAQQTTDSLWLSRSKQEIEACIDHLFTHNNTAPFVVYRLIQRMVTSNPSPRYMKVAVDAFRTGYYDGEKYSGVYGDVGAAVAAILLDREARSSTLQADNNFGSIREPLLKLIHVFRALGYKSTDGREVTLPGLMNNIGMEVFEQSSVFGFYLPENRPSGPISDAGLVGPEVQIATSPNIIGYLNGLASLIDGGLNNCNSGLGWGAGRNCRNITTERATSDGVLTYSPPNGTSAEDIINELDLLLTAGRLNPKTKELIIEDYNTVLAAQGQDAAVARAQKVFIATPEFHSTGGNILSNATRQSSSSDEKSQNRPYKAVIVLFQNGGCDSYNLIVPVSGCGAKDLYSQYRSVRADGAIDSSNLLPITTSGQPCSTFGLHKTMPGLQALYNAKEALFVSNIGALVEPLTKEDYLGTSGVTKQFPPSLFAHNVMQRSMHNLDPNNLAAKGVLGRAVDALEKQAQYKSDLYSLIGTIKIIDGPQEPNYINPYGGVARFSQFAAFNATFGNITEFESESVYAETFARILSNSLAKTEELGAKLAKVNITTPFANDYVSRQFYQVAKLIKLHADLGTERAVFVTQNYGYDTHNTFDMTNPFGWVDAGLQSFVTEMKAQGMWDDVVIVTVSEFGRTLTPNNGGSDHAWGGNHFVAGGGINGGKILGTYPDDLTDDGTLNIGRGRILPSTSWEAVWNGVVRWFGVDDAHIDYVLPNAKNFPNGLFSEADLFQ